MWCNDHSILYFVEQFVFREPVPLMPDGRILLISNETIKEDLAQLASEAFIGKTDGK